MVSKISPANQDKIADTAINPETINVGKLGTKPVSKNFTKIGKNIIAEISSIIAEIPPKNPNGR